jgi:ribonuclease D
MNDLYQFREELYEIVGESEITQFQDGHPFTYPGTILKEVTTGKSKVVPTNSLDRLAKRVPQNVQDVDSVEQFQKCLEAAFEGRFTKMINSYSSEEYVKYKTAMTRNVENYNSGFQEGRLSKESKSLLESFAMMLLVSAEMFAKEKSEKLRPQPEPKE